MIKNSIFNEYNTQPLQLQPDPPAATYQISYHQFKQQQNQLALSSYRQAQLLQQIDKLSKYIRTMQENHQRSQHKYQQSIFLVHLQIMRLRAIIADYDKTIRQIKDQNQSLENIYSLKLQQLKIELKNEFQQEMNNEREKMKIYLQEIKNLYIQKINLIILQHKSNERELELKKLENNDQIVKIDILKIKVDQYEKKTKELNNRINVLEKLLYQSENQNHNLQQKFQIQNNDSEAKIYHLDTRNKQLISIKEQIHNEMLQMKNSLDLLQLKNSQLEQKNKDKDLQMQKILKKYNSLQKQLSDFKNRKTSKQEQFIQPQTKKYQPQLSNSNHSKVDRKQKDIQYQQNIIEPLQKQLIIKQENIKEITQQLEVKKAKILQISKELSQNKQTIIQINNQMSRKNQEYNSKITLFQKNIQQLTNQWQRKQKQFVNLQGLIQSKYIPQISKLNKLITEKSQELSLTKILFQQQIRGYNQEKSKKKK